MKREIKFRAWLEGKHGGITFTEPHMEYGVSIGNKGGYLDIESGWDIHGEFIDVPIMQFTGLKDKNGKEIYEGDMIESEEGQVFVIEYTPEWGAFNANEPGGDIFFLVQNDEWGDNEKLHMDECEVIGNIHENPELLK